MYFLIDYRKNRPEVLFVTVDLATAKKRRASYLEETDHDDEQLVLITKEVE